MKDVTVIREYYKTLDELDTSDQPALTPDYEEKLSKKRDRLDKIIQERHLEKHPLLIQLDEACYK